MSASDNERARLAALARYGLDEEALEPRFVELARLAAHVAGARVATISFVGADRVWAGAGVGTEARGGPRANTLCDAVVKAGRQVSGEEGYGVGTPLRSADGFVLGSLCALDARADELSSEQRELLAVIAREIETQLELRREALERTRALSATREAAEELEEAAARMRAILDTAADGIVTIDERGIIDSFNPAAARIFGYEADEVVGRNVSCLMSATDAERHDGYLEAYMRTGVAQIIGVGREVVGRRKDGSTVPIDLAVSEVAFGGRRMFTGILRDIRERKQVEQAKDEFISTVSHELRTPLTAISGSLRLLEAGVVGALDGEAMELVSVASRNAQRLIRLVNDVLDLERISSPHYVARFTEVEVGSAIARAVAEIQSLADAADVQIAAAPSSARVVASADQVVQVLVNLLSNAVKFSPPGAPVQVRVAHVGARVRIEIVDRGPGIAEGDLQRIFDRFQQVDASDKRRKGGSGLGLTISRAIVERHGGEIGVESEVGRGSLFWVELAAVDGASSAPSQ